MSILSPRFGTKMKAATFASASVVALTMICASTGGLDVYAQTKYRTVKPPATVKLPAPIVSVTKVRPDIAELTIPYSIATSGTRQEYQVISGPNAENSPSSITIAGTILAGHRNVQGQYPIELQANSDYFVRVRNIKTSVDVSNWTTVFFRTPAQFDQRPNPPANVRISSQTGTQVTLMWDDASANLLPNIVNRYEFFINGIRTPIPSRCSAPYSGCTEADYRTITVNRPPAGTTLSFGVSTRDADLNRSVLSSITVH